MAKSFSIVLLQVAVLLWIAFLGGCASDGGGKTKVSTSLADVESDSPDIGRYTAWAKGETKKGEVIKEIERTEQKRLDLKIAEAQQTQIVLDTPEKIVAYMQVKLTESLANAVEAMANQGSPGNKYGDYLKPTSMPKSAFAEGAEVVFDGATKLAQTPAAAASATGYVIGSAVRGAKSGTSVSASQSATVTVNQATATGQSKTTINNGGAKEEKSKTKVDETQWNECITSPNGTPTIGEINGCMVGYGYDTYVQDGVLYLDGEPFYGM